ncbi:hypothetical protein A2X44_04435 [candidate division CPR3 bacterium GWF2_35_18]|uniref:Uncharacterized protein n=1 Tax=candidate division CPR3 bacterium GW2011_GWF2_35_18 TaxID=1618350 RepID=A0A0G0BZS8_UNCC3|nr:MAG: hypothetical protein UR67_C0007G0076 [candidate division CPR3 bacterium GW2011_GWF2_35_18]KKP85669.1 MAG: hypothetical protein UR87_C0041G0007 [candidate division CPR3 bacterium GW2011_GWE2_35_7]OGB62600.1 MAG: hypothetical protein A2X44_04435 [candidate division CPR3 bacterium GWF2_35_18]OGB65851.1 MAG: hypothetical protein A2250_01685 [candidate division CPR3 bacterium RIFOXYA2_FULL_35_13]OGB78827.1 MAG: hypothetical protein A2296_05195 [candidate division CPR3 bacterium RIFOXYB2_FULL
MQKKKKVLMERNKLIKENLDPDIAESVMQEIEQKHVKMRSPIYFVLGSTILTLGVICSLLVTIYLFNLFLYKLRIFVPFKFLDFGLTGLQPFVETFPWWHIVIAIVAVIIGIELLKQYDFSYHKNFMALILIVLVSTVGIGFLLDQIGLNEIAENESNLQVIYGHKYKGEAWLVGTLKDIDYDNDVLTIEIPHGEEVEVIVDNEAIFPSGLGFNLGTELRIVGIWEGEFFRAYGITGVTRIYRRLRINSIQPCYGGSCQ